jgi:site-specific DNA-methyltransferase (adenine-specific)/adenine-specific DNA-methyltransferase
MAKLSRQQIEEIKALLDAGQELGEEHLDLLLPAERRREYELVYAGKTRAEAVLSDTWSVPLQPLKTFGVPKGQASPEWTNRLIFGDNLQVLKRLTDDPAVAGRVKLVYIDPPFATMQEFRGNEEQKAYQDKIAGSAFIEFLRKRLILLRELLHPSGGIYLHLDTRKSHYLKVVMDEVFGENNFQNEIVWRNTNTHNKAQTFGEIHQNILFYSKSSALDFHKLKRPRFKKYVEQRHRFTDDRGTYRSSDLTGEGTRTGDSGRKWLGYDPTAAGRHWAIPSYVYDLIDEDISHLPLLKKLDYLLEHELVIPPSKPGGQPSIKRYRNEDDGSFVQDIWSYQPYTEGIYANSKEAIDEDVIYRVGPKEHTGYPTQKPEGLLSRIIRSCTTEGDLVLDAFGGSGTTVAVAEKLGRRWIGIDCGKLAIYSIQKRLLNLSTEVGGKGKPLPPQPFTLYNAGLYDLPRMRDLPWDDYRTFALQLFQVRHEPHKLGGIALDGFKSTGDVLVFNFQQNAGVQLDEEYVRELHRHLGGRTRDEFYIIAPASRVTFLEDYIDIDETRYYFLRIPYSIIDELHDRPFREIRQPINEKEVNATVEAVGFDFIQPPRLKASYAYEKPEQELFGAATILIEEFHSEAMLKRDREYENRETLSMVMVDYDYKGNGEGTFELDLVLYRHEIEEAGWKVRLNPNSIASRVMIIYIDIFGNELREVKTPNDFGITELPNAKDVDAEGTGDVGEPVDDEDDDDRAGAGEPEASGQMRQRKPKSKPTKAAAKSGNNGNGLHRKKPIRRAKVKRSPLPKPSKQKKALTKSVSRKATSRR